MAKEFMFPSLSPEAWVTSPNSIADIMFAHFVVANYSQTLVYLEQVSSLPWLIQKYQDDITQMASSIQAQLNTYYGRVFQQVSTEVTGEQDANNPNKYLLRIYISFTGDDGQTYNLANALDVLDSKVTKIIKINNG